METLRINTNCKEYALKHINKFRIINKNNWYQVELTYPPYTYKMKCFESTIQIFRRYKGETLEINDGMCGDSKPTDFKNYLIKNII